MIIVKVTQADIDKWEEHLRLTRGMGATPSRFCPIAQSLQRAGYTVVSVGYDLIETTERIFDTPAEAKQFISDCDEGRAIAPTSFFLLKQGETAC
jgi:hypothetical protein